MDKKIYDMAVGRIKKCDKDVNYHGESVLLDSLSGNSVSSNKKRDESREYSPSDVADIEPKIKILYLSADPRRRINDRIDNNDHNEALTRVISECKGNLGQAACVAKLIKCGVQLVLDVSEESHAIREATDLIPDVEYETYFNVRGPEIEKRINNFKPDIVQFACHCSGEHLMVCSNTSNGYGRITIQSFVEMLKRVGGSSKMLVLTCCNSQILARAVLSDTNIKVVVYAPKSIKDNSAVSFSRCFYKKLFEGCSLAELRMEVGKMGYGLEVVTQRPDDEELRFYAHTKRVMIKSSEIYFNSAMNNMHNLREEPKRRTKSLCVNNGCLTRFNEEAYAYIEKNMIP